MALIVFTVIEGRCDSSGFVDDLGSPCTLSVFRPGILLPHACEPVPAHLLSREDIRTCVQRDSDNLRDDVPHYIKASCEHDVTQRWPAGRIRLSIEELKKDLKDEEWAKPKFLM